MKQVILRIETASETFIFESSDVVYIQNDDRPFIDARAATRIEESAVDEDATCPDAQAT